MNLSFVISSLTGLMRSSSSFNSGPISSFLSTYTPPPHHNKLLKVLNFCHPLQFSPLNVPPSSKSKTAWSNASPQSRLLIPLLSLIIPSSLVTLYIHLIFLASFCGCVFQMSLLFVYQIVQDSYPYSVILQTYVTLRMSLSLLIQYVFDKSNFFCKNLFSVGQSPLVLLASSIFCYENAIQVVESHLYTIPPKASVHEYVGQNDPTDSACEGS